MKKIETYWNALGTVGLEHLVLQQARSQVTADGLLLRQHEGRGFRLRYRLVCDGDWKPRELSLHPLLGDASPIQLSADGQGNWLGEGGNSIDALQGCVDVDIMGTPFTNTLAVKYLGLAPGMSSEIEVVYVTIPGLQIRRARQRYTCLVQDEQGSRYLYESLESGFIAEITFDALQLVTFYEGLWERPVGLELGRREHADYADQAD